MNWFRKRSESAPSAHGSQASNSASPSAVDAPTSGNAPAGSNAPEAPEAVYSDAPANRPPRWLWRAFVLAIIAVFIAIFAWGALGSLKSLGVNLLIAFFISLALEPIVVWLVRKGWKRGAAAFTALMGSLALVVVVFSMFGNLFVQQLVQLLQAAPKAYEEITAWIEQRFDVVIPETGELVDQALSEWGNDVASGALLVGTTIVGGLMAVLTIMLVTYYLLASGPKFRASICRYLTPHRQTEMLRMWEITQVKVSDFLNTRIALAAIATVVTAVFLLILGTPYALPLALFTGLVSQFIPTIGTYLGGALPIVVALTSQSMTAALIVLAFILAYQQVENLWLAPKISAKALEMNPAVSFVVVLGFGAVFGALGAFLALPIAATIQAVANTYLRRHELVASPMLADPPASKPAATAAA